MLASAENFSHFLKLPSTLSFLLTVTPASESIFPRWIASMRKFRPAIPQFVSFVAYLFRTFRKWTKVVVS